MEKRKRPAEDEIVERVLKKMKKLVKLRKRCISSSSSSSCEDLPNENSGQSPTDLAFMSDQEINDEIPTDACNTTTEIENEDLDPETLELLGSDPTQTKTFGDNLHKDLAHRWKHILINGLPKDEKVDLLKQYLPAENCAYMKAPTFNPEIKSILSDINTKRDSYSKQKQNQMASCIAAIGQALNIAIKQKNNEIIKTLSDAGRLLCDTHYRESISRRFAIVNVISKQKREVIKNTKIDEHLFGSNLTEHLKSYKAVSASASELRPNTQNTFNNTARTLNARGAPRVPAETRVFPQYRRAPRSDPPPPPAAPAPGHSRDYRRAPPPVTRGKTRPYPQQARRR